LLPENSYQHIIIVGAGGHGSELFSYIQDMVAQGQPLHVAGFVDDHKPRGPWGASEIVGNLDDLKERALQHPQQTFHYITAVGDNRVRRQLVQKIDALEAPNITPWTLRHPSAVVAQNVEIGAGTCLAPGTIVTAGARLGQHCIVNVNASISHDCAIGDFVNINPRVALCGGVKVGEGCYVGAGSTIIERLTIGEWTTIGAGATAISHIPAHTTAVGVPARVIKHHISEKSR
jgi:acetyltransferase EpsM